MSFRGRGRGRGGRFGGPPGILPRDEDGNVVIPKKQEGPPPLYPKIQQLPDLPTITPRDEMLIKRRRQLDLALNSSPYYIEKPKAKTEGVVAEIERYSDRYRVNIRANRPPLSSVLKLAPAYFPVELLGQVYVWTRLNSGKALDAGVLLLNTSHHLTNWMTSGRGRGRGSQVTSSTQWTLQTGLAKNDLHRLDQLASLEQRHGKDEEKGGKEGEEKKPGEGEGEGDEENEELEDEEEEFGDDDYAQNFGFDDDDGYLDVDDGGDDGFFAFKEEEKADEIANKMACLELASQGARGDSVDQM